MSRLFDKLQSALAPIYGNTTFLNDPDDRGYPEYFCKECKERVYEDEYNHTHSVCFKCWYKEGA